MNFEGLMRSFGPHELRKVYLTLREFKLVDEDFLEKFDAAINEGYKQLALENAKTYHEVKKNTEKMKKGEHPTNFVAEGGLVFFKHKTLKCPECGGMVVSSRFCPNGVKESGGYGDDRAARGCRNRRSGPGEPLFFYSDASAVRLKQRDFDFYSAVLGERRYTAEYNRWGY